MSKETKLLLIKIIVMFLIFFKIIGVLGKKDISLIAEPYQEVINYNAENEFLHKGKKNTVKIEKLAEYKISAVVKGKKYYLFDSPSEVSPMDLILVWGDLDTKKFSKQINYMQAGRWYYYRYKGGNLTGLEYIRDNSANVHIIPKNSKVLKKLLLLHKEDYITLEGYLVSVHFKDFEWKSSLSRNDSGNGSCEIMYVENISTNRQ